MSKLKKAFATIGLALTQLVILVPDAFAQAAAATNDTDVAVGKAIAGGFGLAIAAFGGALGQARAAAAALEGIARNPGARGEVFVPLILGLALIESLVIYMFVTALILVTG